MNRKYTTFEQNLSLNLKGHYMSLKEPKVMAIVNLTPDSFYKKSRLQNIDEVLKRVELFLKQGADIIDFGAFSSRPGAELISQDEEAKRLLPILEKVVMNFPESFISVDTYRSQIAEQALQRGAHIVNDIFGSTKQSSILEVVSKYKAGYIGMHCPENPDNMQEKINEQDDVLMVLKDFFEWLTQKAQQNKVNNLVFDPGFGFGKSLDQNYKILKNLNILKTWFNIPILVGLSRKSMIYKLLKNNPREALNGTTSLHTIALLKGADILRVHDVQQAKECIKLVEQLKLS